MATTVLTRTPSSAGNRRTFTWSFWVKRSNLESSRTLFSVDTASGTTGFSASYFLSTGELFIGVRESSGEKRLKTNQVFRDVSAWYHIVIAFDTTQSTGTDRIKLYVNGSQVTSFAEQNDITQNFDTSVNNTVRQDIGVYKNSSGSLNSYFDGSMAHVHLIDGTAYDASAFGETDSTTGIWKPKTAPSVTYGTNGFFLKFENSGAFGTDSSGNSNTFTVNGTMTQTIDTPSNVFATWNPLIDSGTGYSQGNLSLSFGNASQDNAGGTFGVSKGKWYWEHKIVSSGNTHYLGIKSADSDLNSTSGATGTPSMYYTNDGNKVYNASSGGSSYGSGFTDNDIIGIALDLDNNAIWFSKNGSWQNSATQSEIEAGTTTNAAFSGTGSSDGFPSEQVYLPWIVGQTGGAAFTMTTNFGNGYFGTTAVSSAQNPDDGIGIFEYDVPNGYRALCTKSINAEEYS